MKKLYLLLFLISFFSLVVKAQQLSPEVICSATGSVNNGNARIDWVIGETITDLVLNNDVSRLTSGFAQPTYIITAVKNNLSDNVKLYPNPTKDFLVIQSNNNVLKNMHFEMYDALGKKLNEGNIQDNTTNINCSQLLPAIYYLKLIDNSNQQVQTFKIIKQ